MVRGQMHLEWVVVLVVCLDAPQELDGNVGEIRSAQASRANAALFDEVV